MISSTDDIVIRKMKDEEKDYRIMAKWLNDESVLRFYQGRDNPSNINQIIEKYGPRIREESRVIPCFIEIDKKSIGYIQYYPLDDDEKMEYGYGSDESIYGIDLFIGEIEYQNKGMGTIAIKCLVNYIQTNKKPDRIVIDPRIDNKRAIRCYEKCGFKQKKLLPRHELHEGVYCDNVLMQLK